jgi:phage host-nuclease inhibitor protein Gam
MARKEKLQPLIPRDEEMANSWIRQMLFLQKTISKIKQDYAEETEKYKRTLLPVQRTMMECFLGLFIFYRKNQKELTNGKTKIATLLSGKIGTYLSKPEVRVKKTKRVIELISAMGTKFAQRFLREKTTIGLDKDAIRKSSGELLTNAEIAKLVKVIQREWFKVEPDGGEMISEEIEKLEKLI